MADGADRSEATYSAFISYSRADMVFARRLHRQLESYHLPARITAANQAWDIQRHRLKPLFRDLDEMTVAPDIDAAVQAGLAHSHFLLVLCSPRSAQSDWVGREIAMFRALHGDDAILAVLAEGTPETAFHPALRLSATGPQPLQPLAADFRPEGDGPRLAFLKIIAVLAGVGLGELVQRDAQRRTRRIIMIAAGLLVAMAVVFGLTMMAMNARLAAEQERARGGNLSGYMLNDLRDRLKTSGRLDLLNAVNKGVNDYYAGQDLTRLSEAELEQRAKLLQGMGEDDEKRNDLAAARQHIEEARRTTGALLAAAPQNPKRLFAHSQSEYYAGMINWRTGNRARAETSFEAYRSLVKQLLAIDPDNPDWWLEAGWAESNLGVYALRTRIDTDRADGFFRTALKDHQIALARRPGDRTIQSAIADDHAWLGDTQRLRGDYAGAIGYRTTQRRLLEALNSSDPLDMVTRADLVSNKLALARISLARQHHAEAIATLQSGRAAAAELVKADPENMVRAAQLRMFDLFLARTWMAMPAAARPAPGVIEAAIGDCAADRTVRKNAELASFCEILRGHWRGVDNTPVQVSNSEQAELRDQLSERWGLNFAEERKGLVIAANGGN